jgi:hypothetical protein
VKRRMAWVCSVGLLAAGVTGCTSGGTTTATTAGASGTTSIPATTEPPTTTISGAAAPGTPQTATGPSGQKVTGTPTAVQHHGALFAGPPGSWALGLVVDNAGPGSFQSVPASQLALVDASGHRYPPLAKATPQTGQAAPLAAGSEFRMLLIFVLPAGVTPSSVQFSPFGNSSPALQWAP